MSAMKSQEMGGRKQSNQQDVDKFSECILQQKSENTTIKTKSDMTWKRVFLTEKQEERSIAIIVVTPLLTKLVQSR